MGIVIENQFEVPAPLDEVWAYLLDVERIAPCMPGAELTETIDRSNYRGTVKIKLGPVSLSFNGTVAIEERNDEEHKVVLTANGSEQRGKGAATVVVTAWATANEVGTAVTFTQDVSITGSIAQYSGGMIQDVSGRLTGQFAECLRQRIGAETLQPNRDGDVRDRSVAHAQSANATRPISGIRMGIWALGRSLTRLFRKIFGVGGTT